MGQAYNIPQAPHGLPPAVPGTGPATGKPIKEFVDGVPVDPSTGRPMQNVTQEQDWTKRLQMPGQPDSAPELTSPVAGVVTQIKVPGLPVMGVETGPLPLAIVNAANPTLPAMPVALALPAEASGKCITEGCKSKTKDRGMCAKCLKDTLEYMKKDPNITWEFLEANGLAFPSSSARSGNKFLAGLTAKLAKLHATPDGPKQT